jgi:hypothetical protein
VWLRLVTGGNVPGHGSSATTRVGVCGPPCCRFGSLTFARVRYEPLLLFPVAGALGYVGASVVIQQPVLTSMSTTGDKLKSAAAWPQKHMLMTVALGLWVLFVPAAFPVFGSWAHWSLGWRIFVIVSWTVAAIVVGLAAFYRDAATAQALDELKTRRQFRSSSVGAGTLIQALLSSSAPVLRGDTLDFYLPTPDRLALELVASSRAITRVVYWPVGKGVTGQTFLDKQWLIARRPNIVDGTYGLAPEDQTRYAATDLAVIAAMPILNAVGRQIGVLTLSSTDDSEYFADPLVPRRDLLRLTVPLARVLVEILRADNDEEIPGPPLLAEARAELMGVSHPEGSILGQRSSG